jgi:hypothetical protein
MVLPNQIILSFTFKFFLSQITIISKEQMVYFQVELHSEQTLTAE